MAKRLSFVLIPFVLFLVIACSESPETLIKKFNQSTAQIAMQTIPDKALDVFDFQLIKNIIIIVNSTVA